MATGGGARPSPSTTASALPSTPTSTNSGALIRRLLDGKTRSKGPSSGKKVQLSEAEIRHLCVNAKEIFLWQPNLLELEAPINVCVDIHG